MKCIDPVLCYTHANGKKMYRHFSQIHKFLLHTDHLVFNCGKCIVCRKKKAFELAVRCVLHASLYPKNCFLTLTYDEKKPTYHNTFDYTDIQKFKKRLRQHVWRTFKQRIEIFNVHEYGKNGKKHWHLIVFNYSPDQEADRGKQPDCRIHSRSNGIGLYVSQTLSDLWPHGYNTVGDVSEASAMYQAQYMEKDLKNGNLMSHKKSHSKHSGLGRPYFMQNYKQILMLGYIPLGGRKIPVPRYFQKLAHKHFCHYYDQSKFFQTSERKAIYRPFKKEEPDKQIADLYADFKHQKDIHVLEMEKDWNDVLTRYLTDYADTDFQKSGANLLYDLANKKNGETL